MVASNGLLSHCISYSLSSFHWLNVIILNGFMINKDFCLQFLFLKVDKAELDIEVALSKDMQIFK